MVILASHFIGVSALKAESHAILSVDPNAVSTGAITLERLQPIARRYS